MKGYTLEQKIESARKVKQLNAELHDHLLQVFKWEDEGRKEEHEKLKKKLMKEIKKLVDN